MTLKHITLYLNDSISMYISYVTSNGNSDNRIEKCRLCNRNVMTHIVLFTVNSLNRDKRAKHPPKCYVTGVSSRRKIVYYGPSNRTTPYYETFSPKLCGKDV